MSEKTPLLHYRLTSSDGPPANVESTHSGSKDKSVQKLGVVFGVVVPTLLSMFSVVVFLRIGEWKEKNVFSG